LAAIRAILIPRVNHLLAHRPGTDGAWKFAFIEDVGERSFDPGICFVTARERRPSTALAEWQSEMSWTLALKANPHCGERFVLD
jgi:hypothetical protein